MQELNMQQTRNSSETACELSLCQQHWRWTGAVLQKESMSLLILIFTALLQVHVSPVL